MKRIVLCQLIWFCLVTGTATAQISSQQVKNVVSYCKVWGFLKYYHPAIADGRLNWDDIFIEHYDQVKMAATTADCNKILLELCKVADGRRDKWSDRTSPEDFDSTAITIRPSYRWMDDRALFEEDLSKALHSIEETHTRLTNKYITKRERISIADFTRDDKYTSTDFPNEPLRILAIARYWNAINYYYPYKNVIGRYWDSTLYENIPPLVSAKDLLEYSLAIMHLGKAINDSHSFIKSDFIVEHFGKGFLPFELSYINSKTILTGSYGKNTDRWDTIMKILGLHKGEELLKINGKDVSELRTFYEYYIGASNEDGLQRNINNALIRGKLGDTVRLLVSNGDSKREIVTTYQDELLPYDARGTALAWGKLNDSIGYVDMGKLNRNDADYAINSLMGTPAIIFDVRNYPRNSLYRIMEHLTTRTPFVFFTQPIISLPGYFVMTSDEMYNCGGEKQIKYKGKVVILVNEKTQSHAEFTVMALQTVPNAITIGSQTAGADGNVTSIMIPGGITMYFTGLGIFYPSGAPTQHVGVKVNIPIKPTIPGISEGRDEVLERAITYINTGN
jgi:carboxyl-terminal processing protease